MTTRIVIDKRDAAAIADELIHRRDEAQREARRYDRLLSVLAEGREVEIVSDEAAAGATEPQTPKA